MGGGTKWEGGRTTQVSPLGHAKGGRVTKHFDVVLLRVLGVLAMWHYREHIQYSEIHVYRLLLQH